MTTKVLVPLAEGVEEMEAVIMIDVFRRAGWQVDVAGIKPGVVTASRGVKLLPDMPWEEIDPHAYEIIALPGGNVGTLHLMEDKRVLQAIREQHEAGKLIAAVCAGPLVLQRAGVLEHQTLTCHPLAAHELTVGKRLDHHVVVSDHIVTSQGPGTTFAFALSIIALRDGREKAQEIARGMVLKSSEIV
jgi:protein deglycase